MDIHIDFVPTVELFQESRALTAAARGDDPDAVMHYLLLSRMEELNDVRAVIEHLANLVVVTAAQAGALVGLVAGLRDCEPSDVIRALAASESLVDPTRE